MKKPNKLDKMPQRMIVFGLDLGPVNTAISVIRVKRSPNGSFKSVKLLHAQMLQHLLTDLNDDYIPQVKAFIKEFSDLVKKYEPTCIMAERFLSRGLRGAMGEKVSMMLMGMAMVAITTNTDFRLVSAASWKNTFNRRYFTKETLKGLYKSKRSHQHMMDSLLIACFRANLYPSLKEKPSRLNRLCQQLWSLPGPVKKSKKK